MIPRLHNLNLSILIAMAAMLVMVVKVSAQSVDQVQLKATAHTDDNIVQLREIAWLSGDTAGKLGGSIVMQLRESQSDCTITMAMVRKHLTDMGVNWGRFDLTGSGSCAVLMGTPAAKPDVTAIVTNPNQTINATDACTVGLKLAEYLQQYTGYSDQELVIKYSAADERELAAPALTDRLEFEVIGSARLGQLPLVIRRWRGNTMAGEIRVNAQVACKTLAAVVVDNVRRGQTFGPGDVQVQEVLLDSEHSQPVRKLRDVVGRVATRNIHKKQTLFADDVQQPLVIERGQIVTVRALVGGMVIRTTARAMSDAAMGEMIQLQNERSREAFMARAVGSREAMLDNGDTRQMSMAGGIR